MKALQTTIVATALILLGAYVSGGMLAMKIAAGLLLIGSGFIIVAGYVTGDGE